MFSKVKADQNQFNFLPCKGFTGFQKTRHFLNAGFAPGSPEVENPQGIVMNTHLLLQLSEGDNFNWPVIYLGIGHRGQEKNQKNGRK